MRAKLSELDALERSEAARSNSRPQNPFVGSGNWKWRPLRP